MSDPGVQQQIRETITSVLSAIEKTEQHGIVMTEAMTETVVIEPLLAALGYAVWEYQKQGVTERIGIIPDYTLLPRHPRQWFLEVKRWKLPLTDKEANQTVGYAFSQGARWAVLTNGDEWQIFDAYSREPLERKRIFTLSFLEHVSATSLLSLLTKEAMLADRLSESYRARLIAEAVHAELTDLNSQTVRGLCRVVACPTIPHVTPDEISTALRQLLETAQSRRPVSVEEPGYQTYQVSETTVSYATASAIGSEHSLVDFVDRHPTPIGKSPLAVIFPDGAVVSAGSWRQVAIQVVAWCANKHRLPVLPYSGVTSVKPRKYFLNREPLHPNGQTGKAWGRITTAGTEIYIDWHHSARGFCRLLRALLLQVGLNPADVRIRLK